MLGVVTALAAPAAAQGRATADANSFSGSYLAGRVAEADNDLPAAIAYFRRALQFDPANQAMKQSLMVTLMAAGDFDSALPLADELKTVPDVERFSRVALAIDSFRKHDYAKAEHWLKLALETDLDKLITGLMTAWARSGANDHKGALAAVDALSGPPWYDLFVSYHRALLAERAGDRALALKAYEATLDNTGAAAAAPETYLRAAEAHAGYLARIGRKDDALKVIDRAGEMFSGRVQLQALRDRIEAGEPATALIGTPSDGASEVMLNLGSALNRGGGEGFVRLYLRMALALRPDSDAALLQLGGLAEMMEQAEEAIALYERIPDSSPVKKIAELQLGLNLADLKRNDEAVKHLDAVLALDPDDMRAYLALGGVYSAQEKFREAANVYERAVARIDTPTRAEWNIFYQRGIAYERLKEWPKAEPNFRKALELFPDQPQVLNYLGYSWVDMNTNLDEGLAMIRKAVELRPSDGYIVDSLGWAYYRLGRYDDAVRELERAVGLMPNDPILNDHLGDAYWRVGRKLEATFQWSHARDMSPEAALLAEVEKKLAEGLPPAKLPSVADDPAQKPPVEDLQVPVPGADHDKRSEADSVEQAATDLATHRVMPGQSLWSIAAEKLGDGNRYQDILNLNPELRGDPGRLVPGQSLRLPNH